MGLTAHVPIEILQALLAEAKSCCSSCEEGGDHRTEEDLFGAVVTVERILAEVKGEQAFNFFGTRWEYPGGQLAELQVDILARGGEGIQFTFKTWDGQIVAEVRERNPELPGLLERAGFRATTVPTVPDPPPLSVDEIDPIT